jgi:hypothetical protein
VTDIELCEKTLGNIASRIISDQDSKRIRASGASAASLDVKKTDAGAELWGSHYFFYQVHGRKPGKQPPMVDILEWIESKHIEPVDISKKSLAFLIARKIGQAGTDIYTGKVPALAIPAIIELELQGLERDLTEYYGEKIDSTIIAGLDTLFQRSN